MLADGQFGELTGIQYYVDSLLGALYDVDDAHELVAYCPYAQISAMLDTLEARGRHTWLQHPRARVDFAAGTVAFKSFAARRWLSRGTARIADNRLIITLRYRSAELRAQVFSRRFDLLHVPSPAFGDFDTLRARSNIVTIYDLTTKVVPWAHTDRNREIWDRMYRFAQTRCSRVLTISSWSKADIVDHLKIPEERVDVTPLAPRHSAARVSDRRVLDAGLSALGVSDRPFVLYVGTLEPRKNLPRVVTAFQRVVLDERLPHRLVLAGKGLAGHDEQVRDVSRKLGIEDRVVHTGYVADPLLNVLMSACDAFVYVSEYEGFGLPPLEAMVCGAPVITSNVSSLPEVVGEAARQVSPANVDEIAAALAQMLTDRAENARYRALSAERVKHFSWKRTAELTARSYAAALDDR
jgi:glycosyltransferase involved in cell wall biosynthesis